MTLDGAAPKLLVSLLVSLEDVLDWSQDSLECASLDAHNFAEGQSFYTRLSGDVSHKSDLSEVVSFLIIVDCCGLFT